MKLFGYEIRPGKGNSIEYAEEVINSPISNNFFQYKDFLIGKMGEGWIAYDRICDHNGGQLELDNDCRTATCPIHGWKLLLDKASYENGCPKTSMQLREKNNKIYFRSSSKKFQKISTSNLYDGALSFTFNAHASFSVEINGFKLITDPWLIGPCFTTGWWHKYPPTYDSIERLKNSDLIYISHNHPDHLNLETLNQHCKKDQFFLVPNFNSKSVEKILRNNGFHNLIILNFLDECEIFFNGSAFKIVMVKSGDNRDDSSLLIYTKMHTIFFGVDTNMPNNLILPQCDVLFTSFAGGMSGFPMRIDNFNLNEKLIKTNSIASTLLTQHGDMLVKATSPKYVVPYAGYFTYAPRDRDVELNTPKNSPEEIIDYCFTKYGSIGINPIECQSFEIDSDLNFTHHQNDDSQPIFFLDNEYFENEIKKYSTVSNQKKLDSSYLKNLGGAFINSQFVDDLTLVLIPTNDNFDANDDGIFLIVDFRNKRFSVIESAEVDPEILIKENLLYDKNNIELLRIRKDSMMGAFERGLPLEDISIGFQASMFRKPNVYNFKFWDFFTNTHFIRM